MQLQLNIRRTVVKQRQHCGVGMGINDNVS